MRLFKIAVFALALAVVSFSRATAAFIPYPNVGTIPPAHSYTGEGGDVIAYFEPNTATYHNDMAMWVNGVMSPAGFVFPNHNTTADTEIDLGFAPLGSTLVFEIQSFGNNPVTLVNTPNPHYVGTQIYDLYTDPTLNTLDHINHAYTTPFTLADSTATGGLIPPGTFIGFEDLLYHVPAFPPTSDLNYNDEDFVYTNIVPILIPPNSPGPGNSVPEPASLMLLATGLFLLGGCAWRKRWEAP